MVLSTFISSNVVVFGNLLSLKLTVDSRFMSSRQVLDGVCRIPVSVGSITSEWEFVVFVFAYLF